MKLRHPMRMNLDAAARIHHEKSGQMLVAFILLLPVLVGLMGFVLDVGVLLASARHYQNVADAAALAAASGYIRGDDPDTVAEQYATLNNFTGTLTIDSDTTPCGGERCIKVTAEQDVPKYFIQVLYKGAWYARKSAVATISYGPSRYAVRALNPTACGALSFNGNNSSITINGGGSYTRSNCATNALDIGNGDLLSGTVNHVNGGWATGPNGDLNPAPATKGWLPDPLASLTPPNASLPCTSIVTPSGDSTLVPGTYCGLSISGSQIVRLVPGGVYVFKGNLAITGGGQLTVDANKNGAVDANENALIYMTCPSSPCNGAAPGNISMTGNGNVTLKGHPDYENIIFWVDRTASTASEVKICGNGSGSQWGTIYAPKSTMKLCGNGTMTWQIVADKIMNDGTATMTITYDESLAVEDPQVTLTQ